MASFSRRARGRVIRRRPSVRAPITNPQSAIRNPQSAIRNPQSLSGGTVLDPSAAEVRSTDRPHHGTELGWPFCINGGTSLAASSAISPSSSFC
ncbi:MAG: hypothetical protein DMF93_12865 [Acidobacteria bacterium]|nr:MAG: hypothetical protein DMF93_12865 [Acidobacteriota bacterium]